MSRNGFHREKTDTPFGPMDVTEENTGYPLQVDFDDPASRDLFTAKGDRILIRKILATSDNRRSTEKEIDEVESGSDFPNE